MYSVLIIDDLKESLYYIIDGFTSCLLKLRLIRDEEYLDYQSQINRIHNNKLTIQFPPFDNPRNPSLVRIFPRQFLPAPWTNKAEALEWAKKENVSGINLLIVDVDLQGQKEEEDGNFLAEAVRDEYPECWVCTISGALDSDRTKDLDLQAEKRNTKTRNIDVMEKEGKNIIWWLTKLHSKERQEGVPPLGPENDVFMKMLKREIYSKRKDHFLKHNQALDALKNMIQEVETGHLTLKQIYRRNLVFGGLTYPMSAIFPDLETGKRHQFESIKILKSSVWIPASLALAQAFNRGAVKYLTHAQGKNYREYESTINVGQQIGELTDKNPEDTTLEFVHQLTLLKEQLPESIQKHDDIKVLQLDNHQKILEDAQLLIDCRNTPNSFVKKVRKPRFQKGTSALLEDFKEKFQGVGLPLRKVQESGNSTQRVYVFFPIDDILEGIETITQHIWEQTYKRYYDNQEEIPENDRPSIEYILKISEQPENGYLDYNAVYIVKTCGRHFGEKSEIFRYRNNMKYDLFRTCFDFCIITVLKEYGDSPVIFDCSHVENEVKQYEVLDGQGIEIDQEGHVVILGERESEPIKGPWFIFGFRGTDSVSQPHLSSDSPEMEYSDD